MTEIETIVIVNKRASLVQLPGELSPTGEVKHNGHDLMPGENDVPKSYWDKVKSHKVVKMYLNSAVGILQEKGTGKAKRYADGLDSLEKHEAIRQIAKCDQVQILKDWKDGTNQKTLKTACTKRIKLLMVGDE